MSLQNVMRAAVLTGVEHVEVQTVPMPELVEGWSLVRCDYTGLCGTDFAILHGQHPRAQFPLIMGHEISGTVVKSAGNQLPEGVRVTAEPLISCGKCGACKRGDAHVCRNLQLYGIDKPGALAEYVALPNDRLIVVPDGVSQELAALTEPLAVAVHAVRLSPIRAGDQALVFGAGPIGMLTALVARHAGARKVIIAEPSEERSKEAQRLGFDVVKPGLEIGAALTQMTGGEGVDVAFDAAAHPSVAAVLPSVVRPKGTIILVGVYKKPTSIDLQALTFKEITMTGVRVYTRADVEEAVDLIASDALNLSLFPTRVYSLEEIRTAFDEAMSGGATLKVIINAAGNR